MSVREIQGFRAESYGTQVSPDYRAPAQNRKFEHPVTGIEKQTAEHFMFERRELEPQKVPCRRRGR